MNVIIKRSPDNKAKLYKCPNCNEYIRRGDWGKKTCPSCKIELDWRGTEKRRKLMSRLKDNREFREEIIKITEKNPDKNLDTIYRPVLLTTLLDISTSLAVIADKLGGNADE